MQVREGMNGDLKGQVYRNKVICRFLFFLA